jgi:hypothetical protein
LKRTDLEKLKGLKISSRMSDAATPGRYGRDTESAAARRERRKVDQARGLVPFAVKLDGQLAQRIREAAAKRGASVDETVDALLRKGLED